jgi:uncharacterized SAM-binding protein YcdF (DUF218 family)
VKIFLFLAGTLCIVIAFSLWAIHLRSSLLAANSPGGTADAIVLLAGGNGERVRAAARLYQSGLAPKIIMTNDGVLTRWSRNHQRNLYNVEWAREELLSLGVPAAALVQLPYASSGTIYDALVTHQYMATAGIRKITIVTSAYHSGRALWAFRRVMGSQRADISVVPVSSAAAGLRQKVSEIIKFDYYLLRYGLLKPKLTDHIQ